MFITGREQFGVQLRLGDHPFGLALLQTMSALCRTEKRRQRHAGQAFEQHGQIPEHRVDAVVQRQRNHLRLLVAQTLLAIQHLGVQRGVIEFQRVAPQGGRVVIAPGMVAQGFLEALQFKRHGRLLQSKSANPGE